MELNKTTENFSVSMQTWLIEILDAVCSQYDFSRSAFITRAVKYYVLHQIKDAPAFWKTIDQNVINGVELGNIRKETK